MAHPNIALVKYWGKRQGTGNLPAVGSLSITLDTLRAITEVHFEAGRGADSLVLDGAPASAAQGAKLVPFLDRVRALAGSRLRAAVRSDNNFPTGAGLASSAAGFAALALAATAALEVPLEPAALSRLARDGSGSAARSVFGGFVRMHRGTGDDGLDAYAEPLLEAAAWPLAVAVAITTRAVKAVGSTVGMERTRQTSPFWAAWLEAQEDDLAAGVAAVGRRDFTALAALAEHSCLKMHALAMAARPPLVYWSAATLACIEVVRALQAAGCPVFFTVDAGPQLKAVCLPAALPQVATALAAVPGVLQVHRCGLGPGASLVAAGAAPP